MQRLTSLGVLASAAVVAGLVPAMAVENPATPTREIVAAPRATDEFTPTPHPIVRIVLGDAGIATTTGRNGALECLPGDLPVKLRADAITVTGTTIQLDYGPHEEVRAVIVGDFKTIDIASVPPSARRGNEVGTPDIAIDKEFVDGGRRFVDGSEVEAKLCVPTPPPPPR